MQKRWHRLITHGVGLISLGWLGWSYFFGDLAIPERYVMLRSGSFGLFLLVASLACTPLSRWVWPAAVQLRRALGLYAFAQISLHLFMYAWAENALDFALIVRDLGERRAMLIGLIAFALLIPLAFTSTAGWQKRLGKRWRTLHRLVYVAAPLSVWHYLWLDRDFYTWPLIYAGLVAGLLATRLPFFRHQRGHLRGTIDEAPPSP